MVSAANKSLSKTGLIRLFILLILVAGLFAGFQVLRRNGESPLVVYCAHDSLYSEAILKQFEEESGIPVAMRFDTEATKSLGLVELLIREKDDPRCDVFWNNELLGTLRLASEGILAPYKGSGFRRIPPGFKDPDGLWTGFSARLRVFIVNTDRMPATREAVAEKLAGDLSEVVMAKPLYGTTLTEYTVLWSQWGGDRLKKWHASLRERGLREVAGNAASKSAVAEGVCALGWTDTDDFFVAKDANKPVAALPVRLDGGATICIPNTVSIIRGTRQPEAARKLADYLLSEKTELALARSKSRQIPLGPISPEALPPELAQLREWAADGVSLTGLRDAYAKCLAWLKSLYVR